MSNDKEQTMPENKTKATNASVEEFIHAIDDERKRNDSLAILEIMEEVTGLKAHMYGDTIIGFGSYHYKYASGHEGDAPLAGFSPRKQNLTVYFTGGFENYEEELKKLGKHSLGKVCLYIKRLSDVDLPTLRAMIEKSFKLAKEEYGA
jgi:hypothetical protein